MEQSSLVENLQKLPPDLAKTITHYSRAPAVCQINEWHYIFTCDSRRIFQLYIVFYRGIGAEEIDAFIESVEEFCNPQNANGKVFIRYYIEDYVTASLKVTRKNKDIKIAFRCDATHYTNYLEMDIYYEAVCTMLRDLVQRLKKY